MSTPVEVDQEASIPTSGDAPLLRIDHLGVTYPGRGFRGRPVPVLDDVSLDINIGETVGLVGESGSGKTTLGRAVLGLAPITAGQVQLDGTDISRLSRRARRPLAKDIQVVFQDPYSSLNPAMTVLDILAEPMIASGAKQSEARGRVSELLDHVRLPSDAGHRLPREFSGGQRQRIAIARALCLEPRLIVCDEPVSALDLSTQSTVLDILIETQERMKVAYLFISHDLGVVRHISHRVAVMSRGSIVECGSTTQVTEQPSDPYTRRLLEAVLIADPRQQKLRREQRSALAS